MFRQSRPAYKTLAALLARVGSLPGVDPLVDLKVARMTETLVAIHALVRLGDDAVGVVREQVTIQRALHRVELTAPATLKWLLLGMHSLMDVEIRSFDEASGAEATSERPLTRMYHHVVTKI